MKPILSAALIIASQICVPCPSLWADNPPLTPEQLASAKKLYEEGKALYAAGKIPDAIAKLEESYRISRNVFLLYNIGLAYDQSGHGDDALAYYARFLASAPPDAPMRADVQRRVKTLENERAESTTPVATPGAGGPGGITTANFSHTPVYSARPKTPIDLAAIVPANAPIVVSLHYRGTDDATFTSAPMTKTGQAFVGQIPGDRVAGRWIQYYIEVRDPAGKLVHRWGRSTSPNLVNVEGEAPGPAAGPVSDDPIEQQRLLEAQRQAERRPMTTLTKLKWISTGGAIALIGGTVGMYLGARHESDLLHQDTSSCGTPPCRMFDAEYSQVVEARAQRFETLYYVGLGVSAAAVGVAGYLWYRDSRASRSRSSTDWAVVPAISPELTGAAAERRF